MKKVLFDLDGFKKITGSAPNDYEGLRKLKLSQEEEMRCDIETGA
jgi:hypothetical protein